jgi:hypothetical protein
MKTTISLSNPPATAADLFGRITKINEDILTLAVDFVSAIEATPDIAQELIEKGINREFLHRLEKFGRGQIDSRLVFSSDSITKRLAVLPPSSQKAVLDKGVEILDADETTVRNIPVFELSREQMLQAFTSSGMRSIAQQRTFLRDPSRTAKPAAAQYKVHKDYVHIMQPGKYTRTLILQWLSQME